MNKLQLVSDIMLKLQKGKPSDDFELDESQIAFWITTERDGLIKEYLEDRVKNGLTVDDYFVIQESCKPLNNETDPCIDDDSERIYVRLKKQPLDIFGDKGIVLMKTNEGSYIYKARLSTINIINNLQFAKPSTKNLVYYRDGQTKIVIEGIPKSLEAIVEILVWYVPKEDVECLADTDEVSVPNELLPILLERVEAIARRQMFGVQPDLDNNGKDDTTANGQ